MTPFLRTHDFCGSGQFAGAGRHLEAGLAHGPAEVVQQAMPVPSGHLR